MNFFESKFTPLFLEYLRNSDLSGLKRVLSLQPHMIQCRLRDSQSTILHLCVAWNALSSLVFFIDSYPIHMLKVIDDKESSKVGGNTALHLAVASSSSVAPSFVSLLLSAGANANIQNNEGLCPIHVASTKDSRLQVFDSLLNYGSVDVNVRDCYGRTSLWWSRTCKSVKIQQAILKFRSEHVDGAFLEDGEDDVPFKAHVETAKSISFLFGFSPSIEVFSGEIGNKKSKTNNKKIKKNKEKKKKRN